MYIEKARKIIAAYDYASKVLKKNLEEQEKTEIKYSDACNFDPTKKEMYESRLRTLRDNVQIWSTITQALDDSFTTPEDFR